MTDGKPMLSISHSHSSLPKAMPPHTKSAAAAANGPDGVLTQDSASGEAQKLPKATNGADKDVASPSPSSMSIGEDHKTQNLDAATGNDKAASASAFDATDLAQQRHTAQLVPDGRAAAATEASPEKNHHLASPTPSFSPFLLPYRAAKILTLIRHAQGYHNAAGERDREAYKSELYRDAHLTRRGWKQAEAAGRHWRSVYSSHSSSWNGGGLLPRPELVVVSPLNRTLETASAIFGVEEEGEEEREPPKEGGRKGKRLLMRHRPAVPGRVAPAPTFFTDFSVVAHELCREESGLHPWWVR